MTRIARTTAVGGGLVTAAALAPASGPAAALAIGGLVALLAGERWGRRWAVDGGGVALFLAVVAAGAVDAPASLLVVGTVGALVAWDGTGHAAGLAVQLDADARTDRGEAVHVGLTLVATAGVAGLVYLAFLTGGGRVPLVAGVAVAVGAVLVAAGLEPRR